MDNAAILLHCNEETGLKYNTIKVKLSLGMPWRHIGVKGLRNNTAPNFFLIKPTDALISEFILGHNSTCFGQRPCPSSGVIHCTFGTGTCYTSSRTACVQDQDGTSSSILVLHASCPQTCITCASTKCTVDNTWWWAGELPEICWVSYQTKFGN